MVLNFGCTIKNGGGAILKILISEPIKTEYLSVCAYVRVGKKGGLLLLWGFFLTSKVILARSQRQKPLPQLVSYVKNWTISVFFA